MIGQQSDRFELMVVEQMGFIDDEHGVAAAFGVFSGQGYATGMGMGSQLGVQALGVLATGAYTAVVTYGLFKLVRVLAGGLRVSSDEELVGLDQVSHNERGYDL